MLGKVKPREQSGRDSFSRYRAQVRSAAIAALSILDGQLIDRVYCDFHDDFVVRVNRSGRLSYKFYQVKTKGKKNYNWSINDIFGINTKIKKIEKHSVDNIKNSFAGKLIQHTLNFKDCCDIVIFQTNIHIDDNVDDAFEDLKKGNFENKYIKILIELFNDCFDLHGKERCNEEVVKKNISKLSFETDVQYLKDKDDCNFPSFARDKIYEYSEIDLDRQELRNILLELADLVAEKSSGIIKEITSDSIESLSGISINDLLRILSISEDAYQILRQGGDSKALKNASFIQRVIFSDEKDVEIISYCARCKTGWDAWCRNNRHVLQERDWVSIKLKVRNLVINATCSGTVKLSELEKPLEELAGEFSKNHPEYNLNEDLLLGAIFSELVLDNR